MYHSTDLDPWFHARHDIPKHRDLKGPRSGCGNHYEAKHGRRNWNMFLGMGAKRYGSHESPVYTLSRPSQCSPSLFAGIESTIVQIDMVSIMDPHPDSVFKDGPAMTGDWKDVHRKWDPQGDVACLPMYEHDTGPVNLLRQRPVEYAEGIIEGWDERWDYNRSYR